MIPKFFMSFSVFSDCVEGYFSRIFISQYCLFGDEVLFDKVVSHLHDDYVECGEVYVTWFLK